MSLDVRRPAEFSPAELPTAQDHLRANTSGTVPAPLFESSPRDLGVADIPVERYTSQEFHDLEVEKVWKRTWQVACLAQEIPAVGDHVLYDIAGISIVVVRSAPDSIRAFYNACLHRGSALRGEGGSVSEFRCPYHGWSYDLEGVLTHVPAGWDFPQVDAGACRIPQIHVEVWDGWVFVNLDPAARPLADYLEVLPDHFTPWPWAGRHKAAHVAKVIACNWKVALEAFLEGYHVPYVHPQIMFLTGSYEIAHDIYGPHVNRMIGCNAVPNHLTGPDVTQQELADLFTEGYGMEPVVVPEGRTARGVIADVLRVSMGSVWSDEGGGARANGAVAEASDPEVLDGIEYFLFPNFVPWAGYALPVAYRFRPYGNDPNSSVAEILILNAVPEGADVPPPSPVHWLGDDEAFSDAEELGPLGPAYDQDLAQLPLVQTGLHTTQREGLLFGRYQESRIRHFHETLEMYLARP